MQEGNDSGPSMDSKGNREFQEQTDECNKQNEEEHHNVYDSDHQEYVFPSQSTPLL